MRVGIFAPVNHLNLCCTKIMPCYAKYIVSNEKYLNFFRLKEGQGTIILDTAPGLPRQNNLDVLFHATRILNPTYVLLPSRDYACDNTLGLAQSFIRKFGPTGQNKSAFIGVLQGLNITTLSKCYGFLKDWCGIIGLPSPLETVAKREEIIRDLHIKEPIVLIEVHSKPDEEKLADKKTIMLTSFPIRLAMDSRDLTEFLPTPSPLNYEMPKNEPLIELAKDNIRAYLELVK